MINQMKTLDLSSDAMLERIRTQTNIRAKRYYDKKKFKKIECAACGVSVAKQSVPEKPLFSTNI